MKSIDLVPFAPEHTGTPEELQEHAQQLADILNSDTGLPTEFIPPAGSTQQTPKSVIDTAKDWCREHDAITCVIIADQLGVIGTVTLSRIDSEKAEARAGYFVTSLYQGKGYGTQALSQLLEMARVRGIKKVSAQISQSNVASLRIWEKCNVDAEYDNATATMTAALNPRR